MTSEETRKVVSYFNSTSNHNSLKRRSTRRIVVSYFNSTSNHNQPLLPLKFYMLFLISILHQTTTFSSRFLCSRSLFLISILHQTTTARGADSMLTRLFLISILHQTTTRRRGTRRRRQLFLISILHQTTTSDMRFVDCHSVIWPNERYERRMTGRGSRNDAGFVFQRYFSLKVECTSRARNRYMFAK